MKNAPGPTMVSDDMLEQAGRRSIRSLPLYLAVPVLFGIVFWQAGYGLEGKAFVLGALGWLIALMLRGPLSLAVKNMPQAKAKNIIVASSGVLEESIRLLVLALTSMTSSWALSVGQGWAAIEVLFTMVNIFVITALVKRTDEKAMQAKQILQEAQGTAIQASPLWGVMERIWASAFHIGATLLAARHPWTVVLLIPLHSGLNAVAVRLAARSIGWSGMFIAAVDLITLRLGLTSI